MCLLVVEDFDSMGELLNASVFVALYGTLLWVCYNIPHRSGTKLFLSSLAESDM